MTASLIAPHLTIVHSVLDPRRACEALAELTPRLAPIALRLTDVRCWKEPAAGIYVACDLRGTVLRDIRTRLLGEAAAVPEFVPHVTLLHPRN